MGGLSDLQKQTDELTPEEREALLVYLLHNRAGLPEGPSDEELKIREVEMDSGAVKPLTEKEFILKTAVEHVEHEET